MAKLQIIDQKVFFQGIEVAKLKLPSKALSYSEAEEFLTELQKRFRYQ